MKPSEVASGDMSTLNQLCTKIFEVAQNKLDSPMPVIGLYIAGASFLCLLLMFGDVLYAKMRKRLWIPCKLFSVNAFSLTLLTVAMKLPVDLTSNDLSFVDQESRVTSLVFMCVCMNQFMISLGSFDNRELSLNILALGTLVFTVTINVCIHIAQLGPLVSEVSYLLHQQIAFVVIMLLSLALSCTMSVMIPSARRYIELKYGEMHRLLSSRQLDGSMNELEIFVRRHWVMVETGDLQFVLARCSISLTAALLSFVASLIMFEGIIVYSTGFSVEYYCPDKTSSYKWSTDIIQPVQMFAVAMGGLVHSLRWSMSWSIKATEMEQASFRNALKVHSYWTWMLVELRDTPLPFRVQNSVCKKLLYDVKRFSLNFIIGLQILFVSASQVVQFLYFRFWKVVCLPFSKFIRVERAESSRDGELVDFCRYVLLLEGEPQLPEYFVKTICSTAHSLIQQGEKKQPKNLIQLLRKSSNFNGVVQFDSNQVPSLHSQEPPNCWSLPVVTLTAISAALTSIADDEAKQLLAGVTEGLSIVKLIEETLDREGELERIRDAAYMVWTEVDVYRQWNRKDLDSTGVRGASHRETLQNLSDDAEKIVTGFMADTGDVLMQNPLNWPVRVIAANSMYRIARTILLGVTNGENISTTIADILAACLTNLVRVTALLCHVTDFKERQESVKRALVLLGESREIHEILQQRELPDLDVEKIGNIDEWRAFMLDIETPLASPSASSGNASVVPSASPSISSVNPSVGQ